MEKIIVELNEKQRGAFNLYDDGKKLGEMTISISENIMTVYHTGVEPEAEGRGFAKLLLNEMTKYARTNKLMVKPLCPFVHAQFKRHPEDYKDIWLR